MEPSIARDVLLPLGILLVVFGIGLELSVADFRRVVARRRVLVAGTVIQTLVFPLIAVPTVAFLDLPAHLAGGFVLLASCPSGGFSNILAYLAGANVALSITLTVISTLLAVVTMPLVLMLARGGELLSLPLEVVVGQLIATVAIPVGAGIAVRRSRPDLVARWGKRYGAAANTFIYAVVGWMLYQAGTAPFAGFTTAFSVSLFLFPAAMVAAAMTARLAGADGVDTFTIAIEAGVRNMGLATLVALGALGRPEFITSPAAFFLGCAVVGLIFALGFRRYRSLAAVRARSATISK